MKSSRFKFLNLFFICAFIFSGISPACAFISGKGVYIDICASDGTYKSVRVAEGDDAYILYQSLNQGKDQQPNHEHDAQQDCSFCFANSTHVKNFTSTQSIDIARYSGLLRISAKLFSFQSSDLTGFQSRAPPSFFFFT